MPRTKYAKDLKKRKKRKFYKGKPIKKKRLKHGKFVPYISKRERRDAVKIWWWIEKPMSYEGYMRFPSNIRSRMKKIVYKPLLRIDVDPSRLSTKEEIKYLALETIGYEGTFLLKMFGHSKNKYHVTNRTVAKIKIRETNEGLRAEVYETWRISRYWFWRDR